jgi:hypothetical protein
VVWSHGDDGEFRIWFATNNPAGIAEETSNAELRAPNSSPTVVRNVLFMAECTSSSTSSLLDISGRDVLDLKPGANDVRALAPGVYFVREAQAQVVRKVIISD